MIYILPLAVALITSTLSREVDIGSWSYVADTTTLNDSDQLIGYNYSSDTIVIVGGSTYPDQVSTFDGDSETYLSIEQNDSLLITYNVTVQSSHEGYNQAPNEDQLYFLNYNEDTEDDELLVFDTTEGTIELLSTHNRSLVKEALCVDPDGGTDGYIYIAGKVRGDSSDGRVHRYDRDTGEWEDTWSGMETATNYLACAIYNNDLFLFGGAEGEGDDLTDTIMHCPGDSSLPCGELASTKLSEARMGIEAVTIHDLLGGRYVVLMGGINHVGQRRPSAVVDIFDMANQSIITGSSLNTARRWHAAHYDDLNGKIFVFNGENDDDLPIDTIEVTPVGIPTNDPTFEPTTEPSLEPTDMPTENPTEPTDMPTQMPTVEPTWGPTTVPTAPTLEPTGNPTMEPTISRQPTEDPTPDPTEAPTKEYAPANKEYKTKITVYVLVIVILVIICCLFCLCLWYYNKEEEKREAAAPPPVIVAAVAIGGCYKCGNDDCTGNECGQNCRKCGENGCDGVNCGEQCENCGETGCNSQQCYS